MHNKGSRLQRPNKTYTRLMTTIPLWWRKKNEMASSLLSIIIQDTRPLRSHTITKLRGSEKAIKNHKKIRGVLLILYSYTKHMFLQLYSLKEWRFSLQQWYLSEVYLFQPLSRGSKFPFPHEDIIPVSYLTAKHTRKPRLSRVLPWNQYLKCHINH